MTKKIILIFLSFVLVTALMFTGCTPARRPNDNLNQNNGLGNTVGYQDTGRNLGTNNNITNNNMGNYRNTNNNTLSADKVATAVEQIQGVRNATVVVTGNTAYVGVDLDNNATTGTTGTIGNQRDIKREIAQKVRSTVTGINTVYVSTEVGFMDRLRTVGEGIKNGRPVNAFTTELNDMVNRITPTSW
ncbi:MAG: YhcN/YlaJ family sporulation lipoprotein [Lutisporaceae bacterium]